MTKLKLRWKRANESGQVMSQCGRYWFGPMGDAEGKYRLWYDDTGECLGVFARLEAKTKAQEHRKTLTMRIQNSEH